MFPSSDRSCGELVKRKLNRTEINNGVGNHAWKASPHEVSGGCTCITTVICGYWGRGWANLGFCVGLSFMCNERLFNMYQDRLGPSTLWHLLMERFYLWSLSCFSLSWIWESSSISYESHQGLLPLERIDYFWWGRHRPIRGAEVDFPEAKMRENVVRWTISIPVAQVMINIRKY